LKNWRLSYTEAEPKGTRTGKFARPLSVLISHKRRKVKCATFNWWAILVLKYNYVKVKVGNGNALRTSGFKSRET